ncbi:MAG TPA: oligosaccharide flippase family protein [Dehalococcoidia bacterium]|nr:oligosaccharide flippase family protein [Dehalococcoidia bacterium]
MSLGPVRDSTTTALPPVTGLPEPEPEHPLAGRFLLHINLVFVAALASNTLGFFVAILLARALGPEGRGTAALYQAAVSLGFAFLNLGVSAAGFYYVARNEFSLRQATEAGFSISLFAAGVSAVGVGVTALFFDGQVEGRDIPYALVIPTIPAVIQLRLAEGLLRAGGRFTAMNVLELALPLSMLSCLGAVELASGLTVSSAVWAWSLAYLPPLLLAYALLGPRSWPRRLASLSLLVKAVKFGGQGQITNLIQLLNYRLDVFLILVFVNTGGVGLYTVASSQTEGLWIIANSVAIVLLTSITPADDARAADATPVVCRNTMLVTGVGAAGAALIAWLWIPVVFGEAYRESVLPYLLLLPGTVAIAGAKILGSYVFSRGRPIINAWIALATLLATIPTDIVLIHLFGVPGAALGTTLGYFLTLALSALAYRALSGRPILPALLPQPQDAALYGNAARAALRRLRRRNEAAAA